MNIWTPESVQRTAKQILRELHSSGWCLCGFRRCGRTRYQNTSWFTNVSEILTTSVSVLIDIPSPPPTPTLRSACCLALFFIWFYIRYHISRSDSEKSPHGPIFAWWRCWGLCFWHKPAELAHSFLFCSYVYFSLSGPCSCISFHKFSRQISAFSLCSSCLISALLVLSTIYLFMKVSFGPNIILWGWLGLKHQLTNSLLEKDQGFRYQVPEETFPHGTLSSTRPVTGCEARSVSFVGPQQPLQATETETHMVRVRHVPRQPLSKTRGKRKWSAEEMLDGQRHRVDVPAHARTAYEGLL